MGRRYRALVHNTKMHVNTFKEAQGHTLDLLACYLMWVSYESKVPHRMWYTFTLFLILIIPPTRCRHLPPPLVLQALIGPVSFTIERGAESWTQCARWLMETSPNARSVTRPRALLAALSCCLQLTFSLGAICSGEGHERVCGCVCAVHYDKNVILPG